MNHTSPIHPGKVLQDELEEIRINQSQLAAHIGVLPKTINEICNGRRGIKRRNGLETFKGSRRKSSFLAESAK